MKPDLPALWHQDSGLYFVPIRHHSPACAAQLARLLDEVRPTRVLIEGPVDYQPLIPQITDPATRPPVAVVAFPPRDSEAGYSASYYPLCAHSPEYVALDWACRAGAQALFIDLPSDHRMMRSDNEQSDHPDRTLNLADERHFNLNDYSDALCRRTGCRDHNELWDHLFETRLHEGDWRTFFRDLAVYCGHIRSACGSAELERDGTRARERQMAAMLARACQQPGTSPGPTLVLTGGVHTPALIAARAERQARPLDGRKAGKSYLIRYGFRQLDRLSGYAAGMPSPGFYDHLWSRRDTDEPAAVILDLLTGFGAWLADQAPGLKPPLPAFIGAAENTSRLARLRGHPSVTREDLLDGCRSAFGKGEQGGDAAPILEQLQRWLSGSRIGDIPRSAGSPPLLEAVRRRARKLGFSVEDGERRHRRLDIYRKPRHRQASRFLHALALLDSGFGERRGGPDFQSEVQLDRLFEHWDYAWSPLVEGRLVEQAARAETLEAACLAELDRQAARRVEQGRGNDSVAAVGLFQLGCQAGLQQRAGQLLALVDKPVATDPKLANLIEAARRLLLLWRGREVLGMADAPEVERLIGVAYARALYLLPDIGATAEEDIGGLLQALANLHELVVTGGDGDAVDGALFNDAIGALQRQELPPALAGAIGALAYLAGLSDGADLVARYRGHLAGALADLGDRVAFLRGLLAISRELLWRLPGLVDETDAILARLDEAEFIELLPHLRLALSALDPRETDRLAEAVARGLGRSAGEVQGALQLGFSEAEVAANLHRSERIRGIVEADGLGAWFG